MQAAESSARGGQVTPEADKFRQRRTSYARGGQVPPEADKLRQRRRDTCGDSCRENNHMKITQVVFPNKELTKQAAESSVRGGQVTPEAERHLR
jgi:hypothetical protein